METVYDTTATAHEVRIIGDWMKTTARCCCGWHTQEGHWYDRRIQALEHLKEHDGFCLACYDGGTQHRAGCHLA